MLLHGGEVARDEDAKYSHPRFLAAWNRLPAELQKKADALAVQHGIKDLRLWRSFFHFAALLAARQQPALRTPLWESIEWPAETPHERVVLDNRFTVSNKIFVEWQVLCARPFCCAAQRLAPLPF